MVALHSDYLFRIKAYISNWCVHVCSPLNTISSLFISVIDYCVLLANLLSLSSQVMEVINHFQDGTIDGLSLNIFLFIDGLDAWSAVSV